ncbi:hypothetical protein LCGC14_0948870 [marine sediment metagenome]|uniref:Uncharacterized protein n=1 Tax=marine sediment metagenome TaxID=412755 RepID=A0A0F9R1D6_9ZZZZ
MRKMCMNCTYEKKHWCMIKKCEVGLLFSYFQFTYKTNKRKRARLKGDKK